MSGEQKICRKPIDFPLERGSTGIFFDGYATVCGGLPGTNNCFKFKDKVIIIPLISFKFTCKLCILQTNEWVEMPDMIDERVFHSGSLLGDDKWWITGGYYAKNTSELYTSEYLQIGQSSFINSVGLPEKMLEHTMVRINKTTIVFVGNFSKIYMFNATSETFTTLAEIKPRIAPFAGFRQFYLQRKRRLMLNDDCCCSGGKVVFVQATSRYGHRPFITLLL